MRDFGAKVLSTLLVGAAILMTDARADDGLSCEYLDKQAKDAAANVANCTYGLSADQRASCERTFRTAASSYAARAAACRAKKAMPGRASAASAGGTAADAVIGAFGDFLKRKAADDAASAENQHLMDKLERQEAELAAMRDQVEELKLQQQIEAVKREAENIYARRGAWSPDRSDSPEAIAKQLCGKGYTRHLKPDLDAKLCEPIPSTGEAPKVDVTRWPGAGAKAGDGVHDRLELPCSAPLPKEHDGCFTLSRPWVADRISGDGCSFSWVCSVSPEVATKYIAENGPRFVQRENKNAERVSHANTSSSPPEVPPPASDEGKAASKNTCRYERLSLVAKTDLRTAASGAGVAPWSAQQAREQFKALRAWSEALYGNHDHERAAFEAARASGATGPTFAPSHCCDNGHVPELIELMKKLYAQQALAQRMSESGKRCTSKLVQTAMSLHTVVFEGERLLDHLMERPGASSLPEAYLPPGPQRDRSFADSDIDNIVGSLEKYEACLNGH